MSVSQAEVVDYIKNLRLGEVKDLVSVLEDELGVEAKPVGPLVPGILPPHIPDEVEQTEFEVVLNSFGDKKVQVIRVVREATGLGLKEAKATVEALSTIREGISEEEAEELKAKLEEAGGTAEVK